MKLYSIQLLLSISLLLAISGNVTGQDLVKIKKKDFKIEEKELGLKNAWKSVKTANKYFNEGLGSFRNARNYYLDAYKYNSENAELNYMIGVCYIFTDNKYEAVHYLRKAYELNPDVSEKVFLMLGRAYHLTYNFIEAIEEYNQYKVTLNPEKSLKEIKQIERYLIECENGIIHLKDPKRVVIQNVGGSINSEYDDYYPVINESDTLMYFTSRRPRDIDENKYPVDNKYYEDPYKSVKDSGEWSYAFKLDTRIIGRKNTSNMAVVGLSNNEKEVYLYRGDQNRGDIYYSRYAKMKWSKPKKLRGKINTGNKETAIFFSHDGKKVYFVSENPKGFGGADIYMSTLNVKNKWGKPVNIGPRINTGNNEISIALEPNDSVMYFSSNGHNSMGGFDVFKTILEETGKWSEPENLGYPVNTPDDDIFYTPIGSGKSAYYTSIRETGQGGKDIYKVIFLGAEKEMLNSNENDLIAGLKYGKRIHVIPPTLSIDTAIILKGKVLDKVTQESISGKLELIDTEENKVVATSISDNFGLYKITVTSQKIYGVEIIANGYMFFLDVVDLSATEFSEVVERNFELEKVEVGAKVVLKNIYFETGKSTLKSESYAELENVFKLLEGNPQLRIEISGHTDNVGSAKTNIRLSEDRAKSVVNYLVGLGIDKFRLEYKGYGFSEPIAPNNTPEGRAQNRRVEFKILSN